MHSRTMLGYTNGYTRAGAMTKQARQAYKAGAVYQRHTKDCPPAVDGERPDHKCKGLWVASISGNGYTDSGARSRTTLYAKTEAAVRRKLRDAQVAKERGEVQPGSRVTVKAWADDYLKMRVHELSPNGYNAAASPIRKWVIPTIGHKRLEQLTPADLRAVAGAQRNAKPKPLTTATIAATHRVMLTMLRAAIVEGHHVPSRVLLVKAPKADKSDRESLTVPEGLACIKAAAEIPHGVRWLVTLLYGMRQEECLGLTWDAIDFDAGAFGEIRIEWQLQALPYNTHRDRTTGFRLPDGYEAQHLVDSFHLVRPKSKQGYRVAPLLLPVRESLLAWRDVAPENKWGLVWPNLKGRPANDKHDRAEWWGLQNVAEVGHPAGRPYHVHECRNFAATMLLEAGVDESVVTTLLGHSSIIMSRKYLTVRRAPLLDALTRVGERLQLG